MLTTTRQTHIAIIGAGIAGLSCADAIRQATSASSSTADSNPNIAVSVFEKSRSVAGRMSTRRGDGWQCDHGAQYFTANSRGFREEVARWKEAGVAGAWNPVITSLPAGLQPVPNDELARERFVGIPRMTSPAQWLATSQTINTVATIQKLQLGTVGETGKFETQQWRLTSAESGAVEQHFDAVVLAIPAPQALALLDDFAPGLTQLARHTTMRSCWTLMIRFSENAANPFDFDAAFVNQGPLGWIARNGSKPGREALGLGRGSVSGSGLGSRPGSGSGPEAGQETWLLHATPEWSDANLEQDADRVATTLINAFVELGGATPLAWTAHRWRYSTVQPNGKIDMATNFAWDNDARIGLCGDWLGGGGVENAWLSGQRLATQILNSLNLA